MSFVVISKNHNDIRKNRAAVEFQNFWNSKKFSNRIWSRMWITLLHFLGLKLFTFLKRPVLLYHSSKNIVMNIILYKNVFFSSITAFFIKIGQLFLGPFEHIELFWITRIINHYACKFISFKYHYTLIYPSGALILIALRYNTKNFAK